MKECRAKAGFALCLAAAAALGVAWALVVPLGEKPDEPSHLARIIYEARFGRRPAVADCPVFPNVVTYEAVQPPVYYWLSARIVRLLPPISWSISPARFLGCVDRSRRFVVEGSEDVPLQVLVLRLIGLGLALVSGWLVFKTATALRASPAQALVAGALALLTPQVLFVSTGVTNDGLALAIGSLALWLLVRAGATGGAVYACGSGMLCMLAIGVKLNTVPYLAVAPLLIAGARPKRLGWLILLFALGAVAVAGPAFRTLQWSGGGDQRGLLQRLTLPIAEVGSKDYLGLVPALLTSYWARFGWMDIEPPAGVTAVWSVVLVLGTLGWVLRCHEGYRRWGPMWVLLAFAVFGWMLTLGSSNQVQGRFLFPLTGVIALLIGRGIGSLPVPGMAVAVAVAATACNAASILQLREHYRPTEWPADLVIDARQCDADRIVLETLSSGAEVGQTFVCSRPGLAAIDVVFSGNPRGPAGVRLVLEDETTGRMFREATLPLTDIRADCYTRFSFAPVMKSGGRLLRFSLRVTDPDPEGTLSLRFALGDPYLEGVRLVEGNPRDGDLRFVAWADKAAEVVE